MNNNILTFFLVLLIVAGTTGRQCYQCTACPKPFQGNEAGVNKVNVGDNDYCKKTILLGIESRDNAGSSCTPINQQVYCCQGDLCNGAVTYILNAKLLAVLTATVFIVRFFQ